MTTSIYKYSLTSVPKEAMILSVDWDYNLEKVQVWALINPKIEPRRFRTIIQVPTGAEVPDNSRYLGTVSTPEGFVWHFFEPLCLSLI